MTRDGLTNLPEIVKYPYCFVCGDRNPTGLQIQFFADDDRALAEYTAGDQFEGYQGLLHGGLMAALLDEVMIKAVLVKNIIVLTAQMEIRFKKPVATGQKILLEGKITRQSGRLYLTWGRATLTDGTIVAESSGKYLTAEDALLDQLTADLQK